MLLVFTSCAGTEEAHDLSEKIVDAGFAACVQVMPQMTSFYVWDGEMQREGEHLLIIKTLAERYEQLERFITDNHSYDVPEITAVEASRVSGAYLAWMKGLLI